MFQETSAYSRLKFHNFHYDSIYEHKVGIIKSVVTKL